MARAAVLILFFFAASLCTPAFAGDWRVVPIRIDLGKDKKSDMVRLINSGTTRVNLQVNAAEWTQDADGKDIYQESSDLIFLPKILTIEPSEERVLRAGLRMPAIQTEKAYRLFIEEIPEPRKADQTSVSINIRFGLPVFVAPLQEQVRGELAEVQLAGGQFSTTIFNPGNSHFRINKLTLTGRDLEGKEVFREQIDGWYLLAGAERVYTIPLPRDTCGLAKTVDFEMDGDKLDLTQTLEVTAEACLP